MRPHSLRATALGVALAFAAAGCASKPKDPIAELEAWTGDEAVAYRMLEKDDFQAKTSHKLTGNFAHAAEVCWILLPEGEDETNLAFRAYMRPDCSFWNKVMGPLGRAGRVAMAAAGFLTLGGGKQPDWYILQHEQIHFAIAEIAARGLTKKLDELPPERRTLQFSRRALDITIEHVRRRNHQFDSETSGTYDPFLLEKWVRMLDRELRAICTIQGDDPEDEECQVRLVYDE